jgi:hypothetical protein
MSADSTEQSQKEEVDSCSDRDWIKSTQHFSRMISAGTTIRNTTAELKFNNSKCLKTLPFEKMYTNFTITTYKVVQI